MRTSGGRNYVNVPRDILVTHGSGLNMDMHFKFSAGIGLSQIIIVKTPAVAHSLYSMLLFVFQHLHGTKTTAKLGR